MPYGQGSTRAWRTTRRTVLERDKYQCQLRYDCCIGHASECDHIINIASTHTSRRAAVDPDECQAACTPCHEQKTRQERMAGRRRKKPPPKHPGLL